MERPLFELATATHYTLLGGLGYESLILACTGLKVRVYPVSFLSTSIGLTRHRIRLTLTALVLAGTGLRLALLSCIPILATLYYILSSTG